MIKVRFRYHLQKIVDLKSNEKAQAEWILADALSRLKLEERTLTELYKTRESIEDMISSAAKSRISAAELMMLQEYIQYIDSLIEKKQRTVDEARRDVAEKTDHLTAKMKDEKIWLKARERSLQAFKAAFIRKEQAVLDEIASVRFGKS